MLKVWKKIGQTPLELLDETRVENPELKNETLSYAGRLDPMAEGEMLILVGEQENQDREKYLNFDKEYEAEILFGFATDTHDLLGLVSKMSDFRAFNEEMSNSLESKIYAVLSEFCLKKEQKYPVFSSKTVKGKPLFEWYKSGKIDQIEIPSREINIEETEIISIEKISAKDLYRVLEKKISLVRGDFRQEEILKKWREIIEGSDLKKIELPVAKIYFKVSSGTYIRGLAHEMGEQLDIPACLFSLKRIEVFNN